MVEELSLYFHIPLCTRKCPYCHFYTIPNQKRFREALLEGLFLEWQRVAPYVQDRRVVSVYFGGGTPWLLGPEAISRLLEPIPKAPACEITLEANPEEVNASEAKLYAQAGINRLSLGVQSLDDALLRRLGRRHTAQKALDALHAAHSAGIDNLSIDLMYDIPTQTLSSWKGTLAALKDLPLSHLSLYNLTIEPHTSFYKHRSELAPLIPPLPESTLLLTTAVDTLNSLGLNRYEISAFARPHKASRHNLGYWTNRPFLGLGPSAFSYSEGTRFQNAPHLHVWHKKLLTGRSGRHFSETLPYPQNLHERLAIGLRVLSGIALDSLNLPPETLATLHTLATQGYLTLQNNTAHLTPRGLLFYDTVASEIVG